MHNIYKYTWLWAIDKIGNYKKPPNAGERNKKWLFYYKRTGYAPTPMRLNAVTVKDGATVLRYWATVNLPFFTNGCCNRVFS